MTTQLLPDNSFCSQSNYDEHNLTVYLSLVQAQQAANYSLLDSDLILLQSVYIAVAD